VEKILPVIDSFERGLQSVPEEKRDDSVYTGMKLIYDQFMKALTDLGVEPMNAEGEVFDPNLHNAVMQVENDELTPGTVAAELQKGYLFKGTVIRHAMVSVVQES
jgi:molecular chaperone GrpE